MLNILKLEYLVCLMRIVYRLQVHLLHSMLKNVELQGLYEELDCFSARIRVVF